MVDYSSPEKGCEWYFASGMNFSVGPTDAAGQNFDGSWDSLIRECIQNSLDAVSDRSKPVLVKMEFRKMPMNSYRNFFNLSQHIDACLKTFPAAQKQYKPMLDYFQNMSYSRDTRIGYLQISDFNTKGMAYDENNDSCNFSAFVRGLGVHGGDQDASGRGGSFGLGKSTIYKMSPIRTMLVSTFTEEEQYVFEGVASLTTHNMDGEKLSHIGYYDNQEGFPITDKDGIPSRFVRKEDESGNTPSGTDIYVMGRIEEDGDVDDILKSVLTHYWLSIYKGKLVVELIDSAKEQIILNESNLDEYMVTMFPSCVDNAKNSLNPRPYYNSVAYLDSEPGNVCIKKELPQIGNVELYLSKNNDARTDRVAFFRLPCMMVMRKSTAQLRLNISTYGVYGSFICVNDNGDKLLKELENPAHSEWNEKHWRNAITSKIESKAYQVMDELRDFLSEEIEKFCKVKGRASLKMLGAGRYLYTIQDMVEHNDNDVQSHSNGILPGDSFTDKETGVYGVDSDNEPCLTTPKPPFGLRPGTITNEAGGGNIVSPEDDDVKPTMTVVVTPPRKKKNKKSKRNTGGDTPKPAITSDNVASVIVPIDYKVYASKENGLTVHNVCINVDQDVISARISFSAKREDGKADNELDIVYSNVEGNINGMELLGVSLFKGDNMLKVCFSDKAKHVLDINVITKYGE